MNADQIIQGIGKAVVATKPADEFCLFKIDSLFTCMTKAEWSGWMQAIFSVIAILVSSFISMWIVRQDKNNRRLESLCGAVMLAENLYTATNKALNINSPKEFGSLIALFEDTVDQAISIRGEFLPIDARVALNGLRAIARMAYKSSESTDVVVPTDQNKWNTEFLYWNGRSREHLKVLLKCLPEKKRKEFASNAEFE